MHRRHMTLHLCLFLRSSLYPFFIKKQMAFYVSQVLPLQVCSNPLCVNWIILTVSVWRGEDLQFPFFRQIRTIKAKHPQHVSHQPGAQVCEPQMPQGTQLWGHGSPGKATHTNPHLLCSFTPQQVSPGGTGWDANQ